jgi:hypothetical protein
MKPSDEGLRIPNVGGVKSPEVLLADVRTAQRADGACASAISSTANVEEGQCSKMVPPDVMKNLPM